MKIRFLFLVFLLAITLQTFGENGLATGPIQSDPSPESGPPAISSGSDPEKHEMKNKGEPEVKEFVGRAVNTKSGAAVDTGADLIYVDRDGWTLALTGKKVKVRGTEKRVGDLPVFVPKPGEPMKTGIPVATEEAAERLRWRTVLTLITVDLVSE